MFEYKILLTIPGKGQVIVKVIANNPATAIEYAKAQGGPGSYGGVMSSTPVR